ncbi:MAG: hypothetical protein ACT4QA_01255 [Panacagrimonas sp.]
MAKAPSHVGFLRHSGYRDLKIAVLLCIVAGILYAFHSPIDGPNGGTWLGYGLGGLGALIILVLTWLGVRKRRYGRGPGQVKGWLSAHVYLGLALIVIGTLHTGFQLGWNVHGLAYVLMLVVILSGIYGILVYSRLPQEITELRRGQTRDAMLAEVGELNSQALNIADLLSPDIHGVMVRSIDRIRIGGSVREQLFGPREAERKEFEVLEQTLITRVNKLGSSLKRSRDAQSTVMFMVSQIVKSSTRSEQEAGRIQQLLDILGRRKDLVERINRDVMLHARMQIWLYLHVPLTFALLAALLTHVISVFLYW